MRILRAALLASVAACDGGGGGTPDAIVILPDAPPDARPIDAMPGPSYNFTCFGQPFPTTAPAMITAGGAAQELMPPATMAPVAGATIATYRVGTTAALNSVMTAADGTFTTGSLSTGGTPLDGYLHGFKEDAASPFRHTYVFPPAPLAGNAPTVPILMLRAATFDLIASFVAGVTQNDAANGALMLLVTDCANMPILGTTVTVMQGGNSVGTVFSPETMNPMAAGIFFVFNVPAGDVDVSARFMNMTFPAHRVISFKNDNTITTGATTTTSVRPGPL